MTHKQSIETTEQQVSLINAAHGVEAISSDYGVGVGKCSIHKWHTLLTQYTVPELPFPMIAMQSSGRAKIRRMDSNNSVSTDFVMPGDMTIIPSHSELTWTINGVVDVSCIIFEDEQTCNRLMALYNNSRSSNSDNIHVGSFTDSFLYSGIQHLFDVVASPNPIPDNYINSLFYSLEMYVVHYLGEKTEQTDNNWQPSHHVSHTLKKLSANARNKINVDDIAKELNISHSYLSRKFKKEVGMSPYDFLMSKRIEIAQKLLAETNLDIVRIADESGFSSQSNLTRYFTKYVSLPPLKYRRYAQKGNKAAIV